MRVGNGEGRQRGSERRASGERGSAAKAAGTRGGIARGRRGRRWDGWGAALGAGGRGQTAWCCGVGTGGLGGRGPGLPPPPRPFPPFPPSTIVYGFVVHFSSVFHALCHPFLPSCVRNQHLLHTWFLVVCGFSCALSTRRIIRVVESDRYSFASG